MCTFEIVFTLSRWELSRLEYDFRSDLLGFTVSLYDRNQSEWNDYQWIEFYMRQKWCHICLSKIRTSIYRNAEYFTYKVLSIKHLFLCAVELFWQKVTTFMWTKENRVISGHKCSFPLDVFLRSGIKISIGYKSIIL